MNKPLVLVMLVAAATGAYAAGRGDTKVIIQTAKTVPVRQDTVRAAPINVPVKRPALTLVVAPTGNTARSRVREQLVGVNLPNDAIETLLNALQRPASQTKSFGPTVAPLQSCGGERPFEQSSGPARRVLVVFPV